MENGFLDKKEWYVIVRKGTNECLVNKSNSINVCLGYHVPIILRHLNKYKEVWEALSLEEFDQKFGEFKINGYIEYDYVESY
jgi:hypothetical protein